MTMTIAERENDRYCPAIGTEDSMDRLVTLSDRLLVLSKYDFEGASEREAVALCAYLSDLSREADWICGELADILSGSDAADKFNSMVGRSSVI